MNREPQPWRQQQKHKQELKQELELEQEQHPYMSLYEPLLVITEEILAEADACPSSSSS